MGYWLNSAIRETRDSCRVAKRAAEEFGAVTFHCIVTDNVVLGAPAVSVRVGEAGAQEARSRVPDIGGPGAGGWSVLLENPGDVGACQGAPGLNMPANLENSAVATGLEKVSFHSKPKERQCQRMFKLLYNCTHFIC